MYESFYLRAVSPEEPLGAWIRYTVHKAPGHPPRGSVWCTVFDTRRDSPFMHKLSAERPLAPTDGWIALGEDCEMGPARAQGSCGEARWSLRFASTEAPLRHLSPAWLYRTPVPRTKLTSPAPAASFDGRLELPGGSPLELHGWRGMIGHNWGSEHAERWIWLHGIGFQEAPEAWLDVALARVRVAGRLTPWVLAGALSLDGRRHRLGGLSARGARVAESVRGCDLRLVGKGGVTLEAQVEVPPGSAAGWRYADPDGGAHDVVNCSIAALTLTVNVPGSPPRTLHTTHGCAYELGMRERNHGIPIAPFVED
jgi:hypothetical protein